MSANVTVVKAPIYEEHGKSVLHRLASFYHTPPSRIIVTCSLLVKEVMAGGGDDHRVLHQKTASPNDMNCARMAASGLVLKSTTIINTLGSLVRLNIFEALAAAGEGARLSSEELAQQAMPGKPINVKNLERMLRLVSCEQILSEAVTTRADGQVERRFGMEPIGKLFVENADGSFVSWLHWSLSPELLCSWNTLDEFLVDDTLNAFERAHGGVNIWEYGQRNPEFNATFTKSMTGMSEVIMPPLLNEYQGFEEVKVLVDVGGGSGSTLSHIIARHPHIKGINFDQPHIIDACPDIPGVNHVGGDFRESVPGGADTIFMKLVLSNWSDETCIRILKNCFKALPAHGKVIVVDPCLPDRGVSDDGDRLAFQLDIIMMVYVGYNSRERTESEVRKLALEAGFQKLNLICKVDYLSVLELRKT